MIKTKISNSVIDTHPIDHAEIEKQVIWVLNQFGLTENLEIEIMFVDEDEIQALNKKFRHKDTPTDVLSFPLEQFKTKKNILGSLIICPSIVFKKEETMEDVTKHGLLHLLGYDHETHLPEWKKAARLINCEY